MMSGNYTYIPWLFDSREAFEKTLNDSRYTYNMSFNNFMVLYNEYRTGVVSEVKAEKVEPTTKEPQTSNNSEASQILSQDEIDLLISQST